MLKTTSLKLIVLLFLGFYTNAAFADTDDDSVNNLLTDLAPLIALFGERVVMQFMSQSMGFADCVALAMAPIGVITIIVSAIRVAGPTWLKAIIGRARENLSTAEIELMSSTSNEACELWNGRNVVRCPGSGKILQFICLVPKFRGSQDDVPWKAVCMKLEEATKAVVTDKPASTLLHQTEISVLAKAMSYACSIKNRMFGISGKQCSIGNRKSADLESHGQQPDRNDQQSEQNSQRSGGSGQPPDSSSQQSEQDSQRSGGSGRPPDSSSQQSEQDSQRSGGSGRPPDSSSQQSERNSRQSSDSSRLPDSSSQQSDQNRQRFSGSSRPPDSSSQQSEQNGRPSGNQSRELCDNLDPKTPQIIIVRDTKDDVGPNVSLNCHNCHNRTEMILIAAFGMLLQVGVLVYCGFATRNSSLRRHLLKNDKPVQDYAFPLTASGTILLAIGVLICGIVVERSTDEIYYEPNEDYDAYVVWLQKESIISEQIFKPFAIYPTSKRTSITMSRRSQDVHRSQDAQNSHDAKKEPQSPAAAMIGPLSPTTSRRSKNAQNSADAQKARQSLTAAMIRLQFLTTVGCLVSIVGFVLQFMGLRGLNYTASVAQFSAMAIMTVLRAVVRRGLVEAPRQEQLLQGFELDWLARSLETKHPSWMTSGDHDTTPDTVQEIGLAPNLDSEGERLHRMSQQEKLQANILDIRRKLGSFVQWYGPASNQAELLSKALRVVASELLSKDTELYEFEAMPHRELWNLKFGLELQDNKWDAQPCNLEAALSLWVSSLQAQEKFRDVQAGDGKGDGLRAQRAQQTQRLGLRILGKSLQSHVLMRDLQFHIPAHLSASIPNVLGVEEYSPDKAKNQPTLEAIPSYHVVEGGLQVSDSFSHPAIAHARYFDVSEGFSLDAPEIEQWHRDDRKKSLENIVDFEQRRRRPFTTLAMGNFETRHRRRVIDSAEQELRDLTVSKLKDHMAVYTRDGFERLLARQIFFAFMKSIGAACPQWEEDATEVIAKDDAYDWKALKINNKKLSGLVSKIRDTGFLSLEDAWFDVVAPLSLANALPGNSVVLNYIQRQAKQCIKESKFDRLKEVLKTLFRLAVAFDNNDGDCMLRAIAIFQYYREFAKTVTKIAREEDRSAWFIMDELEREFVRPFEKAKGADLAKLCSVFVGQFSLWSDLSGSNLSGLYWSNIVQTGFKSDNKFKLTENHIWALKRSSEETPYVDKSHWLQHDILGWTPIHYLAAFGQPKTPLSTALKSGIKEDCRDCFGFAPLHYACLTGNEKMVRVLLDSDAPIEVQQLDGVSPLHIAAIQNDTEPLRLLLQAASERKDKKRHQSKNRRETSQDKSPTLLDYDGRAAVHWAAMYGNIEAVRLLAVDLSLQDFYGWNCLHLAVMHGKNDLAKHLIAEGELKVDAVGNDGRTPLHMAIQKQQEEIIECLLEKGTAVNTTAANGSMPFHQAVDKCGTSVVNRLIQGDAKINIQEKSPHRWNPIHYAVRRGNLEILKLLLDSEDGQKACRVKSEFGDTPLHLIAHWCRKTGPEMVKMIYKHLGTDVNPQDNRGETPLHKAVEEGDLALTKSLLDIGATESLFLPDKWQETPLEVAKGKLKKKNDRQLEWYEQRGDWSQIIKLLEQYKGPRQFAASE